MNIKDIKIKNLSYDSRKINPGDVFVAIPGLRSDGYDFIPQAIEKGAAYVVAEKDFTAPPGVQKIIVPDARVALAELASRFYHYPGKRLKLIGITGTNGKTTIAYLLESILREAGIKVGLISTAEIKINGKTVAASSMTTPGPLELQGILSKMVAEGVTHAVMEVSSHALSQERIHGLEYDAAIYTNLSHEHLDYHKTMDEYLDAKSRLFGMIKPDGIAIINIDDPFGRRMVEEVEGEVSFYGIKDMKHELRTTKQSEFDARVKEYDIRLDHMRLRLDNTEIRTPLIGIYNIYNILAAFQCGLFLNIGRNTIKKGIEKASVPGRLERIVSKKGFMVIIDFAHTPDGLHKMLETIKPLVKGRLIVVFGCPGDRDREKRPIMGEIAARFADQVIVTTDDPHSEEPGKIIEEILKGATGNIERVTRITDRREAIKKAIDMAEKGDVVVLAGRGHEKYQDFNGKKIELDDREEALKYL